MTRYAFINADGIVVQVIVGDLTERQQDAFLNDYASLFGAERIVAVEEGTSVWIGGTYTDGEFIPPPTPEPVVEPEVAPELQEPV